MLSVFNPDYAIGFVMIGVITKKSGYLETEAQHRYGEVENSNEVADFVRRGGSSRNRGPIVYFGFNVTFL